jgi:hypothetical protein
MYYFLIFSEFQFSKYSASSVSNFWHSKLIPKFSAIVVETKINIRIFSPPESISYTDNLWQLRSHNEHKHRLQCLWHHSCFDFWLRFLQCLFRVINYFRNEFDITDQLILFTYVETVFYLWYLHIEIFYHNYIQ